MCSDRTEIALLSAVILVGGIGTRLGKITKHVPKPMIKILDVPFLTYLLRYLASHGICNVILSTGYKGEIIKQYYEDGRKYGLNINYCHEKKPLGTGGAIYQALITYNLNTFIVLNGDSFINCNLVELFNFHKSKNSLLTLCLTKVPEPDRFGSVIIDTENKVLGMREKSKKGNGIINAGIYIIDKELFKNNNKIKFSFEYDIMQKTDKDKIYGKVYNLPFIDIGTSKSLMDADKYFKCFI